MDDQRGIMEKDQNNHDEKGSESSSSSTMAVDESISIDENKKAKGVLNGNLVGKEELKDESVIDVKLDDDDDDDREMVCRICHLSCDQSPERGVTSVDGKIKESILIQLGCGCKDELGIAHSHCAEAWFKLKGNRFRVFFLLPAKSTLFAKGLEIYDVSRNSFILLNFEFKILKSRFISRQIPLLPSLDSSPCP